MKIKPEGRRGICCGEEEHKVEGARQDVDSLKSMIHTHIKMSQWNPFFCTVKYAKDSKFPFRRFFLLCSLSPSDGCTLLGVRWAKHQREADLPPNVCAELHTSFKTHKSKWQLEDFSPTRASRWMNLHIPGLGQVRIKRNKLVAYQRPWEYLIAKRSPFRLVLCTHKQEYQQHQLPGLHSWWSSS